jgi:hypothetical protein
MRRASAVAAPPVVVVAATVMASDVKQTGHMALLLAFDMSKLSARGGARE